MIREKKYSKQYSRQKIKDSNMTDIQLRPYQVECKKAIKTNYDKGIKEQLIVEATGLGKRLQAVELMKHFNRSLFIAHREELIGQAYDEISKFWPMQVGIIKGPTFELDKKIVVASVQTLQNRLERIKPETFDYVVIDECHNYLSPSYLRTIRHFKPKLRTAWTATPKRLDGLSLTNIAQEVVFQYRIEDGIKDGWLAGVEAYQIRTNTNIADVRRVAGDFNQGQLSERVDSRSRNAMIATKYLHYARGRQAIAYCVDVKHSYNLRDILREHGVNAETIVGDPQLCPNRRELINRFKNGEIDVLTNCEVLTEGFDYHDIGCILMGRPTQSERLYIQAIGRGTRLKSKEYIDKFGSNTCIVLDFVDNSGRLSLVNSYELEKDKPIEDRMFLPKEHKEKLLALKEERERKIKIQTGQDQKINLLKLPEFKVWNSEKMLEPATEKQINWIKQMGIWQEDVEYTKSMASELISAQPAKEWQIRWLAENKYDVSNGCSLGQFQRVKYSFELKNKFAMDEKEKNKILNKLKNE
ncbi:MAG: DEAD/DEAH box helicase [Clostridia bacterium]|nr:DEAD/DEAH box helicase [Clostridia bacterium]